MCTNMAATAPLVKMLFAELHSPVCDMVCCGLEAIIGEMGVTDGDPNLDVAGLHGFRRKAEWTVATRLASWSRV